MIAAYARYRLPLHVPMRTARGVIDHREGVLVQDQQGRVGDACPLPGWSSETIDDVVAHLQGRSAQVPKSLSFAFSTAAAPGAAIPVVAMAMLIDDARHPTEVALTSTTLKLKVGAHGHDVDLAAIASLRVRVPSLQLRLDGNRQLSVEHTHALAAAAGSALQWCEEPVPLSLLSMLDASIPVAADEVFFIEGDDQQASVLRDRAIAWVLKPTLLGMPQTTSWMDQARERQKIVIISSVFESGVGRAALARLADDGCGQAHGLGTARFFASELNLDALADLDWVQR
jgi:O-succinylbenzoate synthase